MRYVGKVYRPPSEANAYILQATIGCSWNKCTYCTMYDDKPVFRNRDIKEVLEDIAQAGKQFGDRIEKVFVADGDALIMPLSNWLPILEACYATFPKLRRVSCYAMASNIVEKSDDDLRVLREAGLKQLYIGPESGDDPTLKRIAKGSTFDEHVEAAQRAKAAGMKQSAIFLLGAGGIARSEEHAFESARLATAMNPEFLSALTLTVIPNTPIARLQERGKFVLPDIEGILKELRIFIANAKPSSALFRTNHASNYLPLGGTLPRDSARLVTILDMALSGEIPLREEWMRGL